MAANYDWRKCPTLISVNDGIEAVGMETGNATILNMGQDGKAWEELAIAAISAEQLSQAVYWLIAEAKQVKPVYKMVDFTECATKLKGTAEDCQKALEALKTAGLDVD